MNREDSRCPACGSAQLQDFLEYRGAPANVGMLWPSREAARRAPAGDIVLAHCQGCDAIHNRRLDPSIISYDPGYDISLNFSGRYSEYIDERLQRLLRVFGLAGKSIVEVGCGSGYFLEQLCELASARGTGFDPCVRSEQVAASQDRRVQFVRDRLRAEHREVPADLFLTRHVLQQIPDALDFISEIRRTIGDRVGTGLYVEIPNAAFVFGELAIWNVFYEHCNYMTPEVLASLVERCGFEVREAAPCYDQDQYMYVDAVAVAQESPPAQGSMAPRPLPESVRRFAERYEQETARWREALVQRQAAGDRIVAWGSGGRGITFLTKMADAGGIEHVVDINPDRQGTFVPTTAQEVIAPERLCEIRPDLIVITNATYAKEIERTVAAMAIKCELTVL